MEGSYVVNINGIIIERLNQYKESEPIFVDEIVDGLEDHMEAVYVALNRLKEKGILEKYKKGIYYKLRKTRFGTIGIDKSMLIEKAHVMRNNEIQGYITGPEIWNRWGLTTQIPNKTWIAKDIRQKKVDQDMKVVLIKARGEIKKTNVKALQFLDVLEHIDLIQDSMKEDIIEKLTRIFRTQFGAYDKIVALEEVKKYKKTVRVLFGLIAEKVDIKDEYFLALLKYFKDDVRKGKKIILTVNPDIFNGNRDWGNGYATAFNRK